MFKPKSLHPIVVFIVSCYGIAEDYIQDIYDMDSTTVTSARKSKNKYKAIDTIDDDFSDFDNWSIRRYDEFINKEFQIKHEKSVTYHQLEQTYPNVTEMLTLRNEMVSDIAYMSPLELLNEYEYIYDDNKTMPLMATLPTENPIVNIDQFTENNNDHVKLSDDRVISYNVKPAAIMPLTHKTVTTEQSDVWYIPENYACWRLPFLYGELGMKRYSDDIFTIYRSMLKNVINMHDIKSTPNHEEVVAPILQTFNKWCGIEPCYGDHILCLFTNNVKSKLCDRSYKVFTPTMFEQIALVNTINAMRNRIATGVSDEYPHLPPAANMNQIMYDNDLEKMSRAWLNQCLPGPAPCAALNNKLVTHLECTRYARYCCIDDNLKTNCVPRDECFVPPIIGCLYAWFSSAGRNIDKTDVECGHANSFSFNTVQLIWANTNKIGCAYGKRDSGDIRVVCNFAPGAPFFLKTKYYCGLIAHNANRIGKTNNKDYTDSTFLSSLGLKMRTVPENKRLTKTKKYKQQKIKRQYQTSDWYLKSLLNVYMQARFRNAVKDYSNGTRGLVLKLVTEIKFIEESDGKCDTNESIYVIGSPGSLCAAKGRKYHSLCYDFGNPTPGYRAVAIVAPIALFALILYDLFSGVMTQNHNQ
ncbi:hypothetical protein ACJJTC_005962 [Scirpophaga incertulas]